MALLGLGALGLGAHCSAGVKGLQNGTWRWRAGQEEVAA